ncbi:MAG: ATP-dependent zinc protease [Myxococcales bacterium]|nr:ATP-dependent zinc protease [Myxococcales bacterium]USN50419.1 MAG: ATP-dependent zinc protease [Myxococcales bacterium]
MDEKKLRSKKREKILIGWKEWCALPELNIKEIKAKIDTGAATSALHAEILSITSYQNQSFIRFKVYVHQSDRLDSKICKARLIAQRNVMSSNGLKEKRYVIISKITVGKTTFDTQITLSDRSPLRFRMLLGRLALRKYFLIDPSKAHLQGRPLFQPFTGEK